MKHNFFNRIEHLAFKKLKFSNVIDEGIVLSPKIKDFWNGISGKEG